MFRIKEEFENLKKNQKLGSIGCTVALFNESNYYKWKHHILGQKTLLMNIYF